MLKSFVIKRSVVVIAGVVVVAAALGGGWSWYTQQQAAQAGVLHASGRLEATEIDLSSELGGKLATRAVREGDRVQSGSVLVTFDIALLDHQIQTAADTVTRLHLQMQRDRQTLQSPLDGWVVRTDFEPGEIVPPGVPVVVVADWRNLTLKVYLPEDQFGRVTVGQSAHLSVDAYSGVFHGTVTSIASDAEFTPRDMQTQEDRVKSVYAIKLSVPNGDLRLKPGMFADVTFRIASGRGG